jgi:hypothetical protein
MEMSTDDQRTVESYLEAMTTWGLDDATAASLIGMISGTLHGWQNGHDEGLSEEALARMIMVAQIRTALDIYWPAPLNNQWIKLQNKGFPYQGLSPIEYVAQNGWPALYRVLRQVQAWAVGNA